MKSNLDIHSGAQLAEYVQEIGFLPLLDSGIIGYSAEDVVADDCRYVVFADGGWDWPMWKWKGPIVTDGGCVYGKFFRGKSRLCEQGVVARLLQLPPLHSPCTC